MTRGLYAAPLDKRDSKDFSEITRGLSAAGKAELAARRQAASLVLGRVARLSPRQRSALERNDFTSGFDFGGHLATAEDLVGPAEGMAVAHDTRRAQSQANIALKDQGLELVYKAALAEAAKDGLAPAAYTELRRSWEALLSEE